MTRTDFWMVAAGVLLGALVGVLVLGITGWVVPASVVVVVLWVYGHLSG